MLLLGAYILYSYDLDQRANSDVMTCGCIQVLEDESLNEQEYEQHLSDLIREGKRCCFTFAK